MLGAAECSAAVAASMLPPWIAVTCHRGTRVMPALPAAASRRTPNRRYCSLMDNGPLSVESARPSVPEPSSMRRLFFVVSRSARAAARLRVAATPGQCAVGFDDARRSDSCAASLSESGPFCVVASSEPLPRSLPSSFTEIGPFCARSFTLPLSPAKVIGPLTAIASIVPLISSSRAGRSARAAQRAVHFVQADRAVRRIDVERRVVRRLDQEETYACCSWNSPRARRRRD